MKLLLWKILAVFSVVLGSLGPHVVAGAPAPVPTPEPNLIQTETIPVLTARSEVEVVVAGHVSPECAGANLQLGRFDLILWHACDVSLTLGSAQTAEVSVIRQQPNWPELSVTGGPKHSLSSDYAPWSAPEKVSATMITGPATGLPEQSTGSLILPIETSRLLTINSDLNADNSQQTIVMRC